MTPKTDNDVLLSVLFIGTCVLTGIGKIPIEAFMTVVGVVGGYIARSKTDQ